jgi:hypothetical protein
MPRGVSRCPQCGEPVSAFAAGCAICGADLEAERARRAARGHPAVRLGRGPAWARELDWPLIAIGILLALAASPVAFLLTAYWAWSRWRDADRPNTLAMLLVSALSLTVLSAPFWFWSHIFGL